MIFRRKTFQTASASASAKACVRTVVIEPELPATILLAIGLLARQWFDADDVCDAHFTGAGRGDAVIQRGRGLDQ